MHLWCLDQSEIGKYWSVEGGGVEVTGDGTYEIILTKAQAGGSVKATGQKFS